MVYFFFVIITIIQKNVYNSYAERSLLHKCLTVLESDKLVTFNRWVFLLKAE